MPFAADAQKHRYAPKDKDTEDYIYLVFELGSIQLEHVNKAVEVYLNYYSPTKEVKNTLKEFNKISHSILTRFSLQDRSQTLIKFLGGFLLCIRNELLSKRHHQDQNQLKQINDLIDVYYGQPMKSDVRTIKDENEILKTRITSYDERIEVLKKEIEDLKNDNKECLNRISKLMMEQEFGRANANENLTDTFRISEIKSQFRNLYVDIHGCVEADLDEVLSSYYGVKTLHSELTKEKFDILLDVLFSAFDYCGKRVEAEKAGVAEKLSNIFSNDPFNGHKKALSNYIHESVCNFLKGSPNPEILKDIKRIVTFRFTEKNQSLTKAFDDHKSFREELSRYISKCVEITWLMQCSNPPLLITTSVDKFNKKLHQRHGGKGEYIDYYIWPILFSSKEQFERLEIAYEKGDVSLTSHTPRTNTSAPLEDVAAPKRAGNVITYKDKIQVTHREQRNETNAELMKRKQYHASSRSTSAESPLSRSISAENQPPKATTVKDPPSRSTPAENQPPKATTVKDPPSRSTPAVNLSSHLPKIAAQFSRSQSRNLSTGASYHQGVTVNQHNPPSYTSMLSNSKTSKTKTSFLSTKNKRDDKRKEGKEQEHGPEETSEVEPSTRNIYDTFQKHRNTTNTLSKQETYQTNTPPGDGGIVGLSVGGRQETLPTIYTEADHQASSKATNQTEEKLVVSEPDGSDQLPLMDHKIKKSIYVNDEDENEEDEEKMQHQSTKALDENSAIACDPLQSTAGNEDEQKENIEDNNSDKIATEEDSCSSHLGYTVATPSSSLNDAAALLPHNQIPLGNTRDDSEIPPDEFLAVAGNGSHLHNSVMTTTKDEQMDWDHSNGEAVPMDTESPYEII